MKICFSGEDLGQFFGRGNVDTYAEGVVVAPQAEVLVEMILEWVAKMSSKIQADLSVGGDDIWVDAEDVGEDPGQFVAGMISL